MVPCEFHSPLLPVDRWIYAAEKRLSKDYLKDSLRIYDVKIACVFESFMLKLALPDYVTTLNGIIVHELDGLRIIQFFHHVTTITAKVEINVIIIRTAIY